MEFGVKKTDVVNGTSRARFVTIPDQREHGWKGVSVYPRWGLSIGKVDEKTSEHDEGRVRDKEGSG